MTFDTYFSSGMDTAKEQAFDRKVVSRGEIGSHDYLDGLPLNCRICRFINATGRSLLPKDWGWIELHLENESLNKLNQLFDIVYEMDDHHQNVLWQSYK